MDAGEDLDSAAVLLLLVPHHGPLGGEKLAAVGAGQSVLLTLVLRVHCVY